MNGWRLSVVSREERVAEILHRDMVALRVGARPWAEQSPQYRAQVAASQTVADVIAAVLNDKDE
jgi:hypothetical protein